MPIIDQYQLSATSNTTGIAAMWTTEYECAELTISAYKRLIFNRLVPNDILECLLNFSQSACT